MRVKLWDRKRDYDTVVGWWKGQGCGADHIVPTHRLPPTGWMVEDDDGTPLCITWIYYFQHISGALVGSVVANPTPPPKLRAKALDLLFLRVATEADKNNCGLLLGVTTREGLVRKLKKHGFFQTTKHSVEFQRELGGH